jgi:hypothetical protein
MQEKSPKTCRWVELRKFINGKKGKIYYFNCIDSIPIDEFPVSSIISYEVYYVEIDLVGKELRFTERGSCSEGTPYRECEPSPERTKRGWEYLNLFMESERRGGDKRNDYKLKHNSCLKWVYIWKVCRTPTKIPMFGCVAHYGDRPHLEHFRHKIQRAHDEKITEDKGDDLDFVSNLLPTRRFCRVGSLY